MLDYQVLVIDPREEYANGWDVRGRAALARHARRRDRRTQARRPYGVVALTHDPKLDDLALMEALKSRRSTSARSAREEQRGRAAAPDEEFDVTEARSRACTARWACTSARRRRRRSRWHPRRDDRGAPRLPHSSAGGHRRGGQRGRRLCDVSARRGADFGTNPSRRRVVRRLAARRPRNATLDWQRLQLLGQCRLATCPHHRRVCASHPQPRAWRCWPRFRLCSAAAPPQRRSCPTTPHLPGARRPSW